MTSFLSLVLLACVMVRYNDIVGHPTEEVDLEEDIKDIDQQDRYEHLYNTRFEQENIVTYPRWDL